MRILLLCLFALRLAAQTYPPPNPNDYQPPPLPTVRGGEIKDPQTQMVMRRVTLPGDIADGTFWAKANPIWYAAGNMRTCSEWALADGGHLCAIQSDGGSAPTLYWIHPGTGAVQFRGVMWMPLGDVGWWSYIGMEGGIPTDPTQPGIFWQVRGGWLVKGIYQDPGKEIDQNKPVSIVWTKYADVRTKFASQYPGRMGPGQLAYMDGDNFVMQQRMYWQDSPGVVSVYSLSQGKFLGSMESWSKVTCRWCGLHSTVPMAASFPVAQIVVQSLCGGGATGPYSSKLTKAVNATDTVFEVDSEPINEDPNNGPRQLQNVQVGDRIGVNGCHGGEQETMTVTAKNGLLWTMKRGTSGKAWAAGTKLVMIPNTNTSDFWYNPLTDQLVPDPNQAGSHRATRQPYDMNADYSMRTFANFNDLATKAWDKKWSWVFPGTEQYPMVQHQRHPSVTTSGRVYDVYSVYPQSATVSPMNPAMGGLNSWDLTQPSVANTAKILGRMLSSPIIPNLSLYANVHPIVNKGTDTGWVIGMGANEKAVFIYKVGSSVTPPPPCDCCPECPTCPVCPPPDCDCAALQKVITAQGQTISNQQKTIDLLKLRVAQLEKIIQDAIAVLSKWPATP